MSPELKDLDGRLAQIQDELGRGGLVTDPMTVYYLVAQTRSELSYFEQERKKHMRFIGILAFIAVVGVFGT